MVVWSAVAKVVSMAVLMVVSRVALRAENSVDLTESSLEHH